jgi:hypothetical protein
MSRLAFTWLGISYLSIGFYFFGIGVYQLIGRLGASDFSSFTYTTNHALGTRTMTWVLITFVPVGGIIFDVCGKLYSNMFYPTQTQIHTEIESKLKIEARKRRQSVPRHRTTPPGPQVFGGLTSLSSTSANVAKSKS